jgi:cation diffusion facilitator CzcD-associated flavoprotein CzcO
MRTNSSRVMTEFSDLAYPPGTAVYPAAEEVGAYLTRYAEQFGLVARTRLDTRVEHVGRDGSTGGWTVRTGAHDRAARTETFARVVVATGWCGRPTTPSIEGLAAFAGRAGVAHAADYRGADPYRGLRVLVLGGGITALEVASELAQRGAARVVVASRRQRYVIQKLLAGVPADHVAFTRFAALAAESFPPAASEAGLRALVVGTSGSPEQFGAPRPADSLFAAGLTLSQQFLPLVADGRIAVRPWVARLAGEMAHFADGAAEPFDAIVLATGYTPALPFLGADVRAATCIGIAPGGDPDRARAASADVIHSADGMVTRPLHA